MHQCRKGFAQGSDVGISAPTSRTATRERAWSARSPSTSSSPNGARLSDQRHERAGKAAACRPTRSRPSSPACRPLSPTHASRSSTRWRRALAKRALGAEASSTAPSPPSAHVGITDVITLIGFYTSGGDDTRFSTTGPLRCTGNGPLKHRKNSGLAPMRCLLNGENENADQHRCAQPAGTPASPLSTARFPPEPAPVRAGASTRTRIDAGRSHRR